jgi:1,4-dihydroxy-2-naphthoate octaprenyltransferase
VNVWVEAARPRTLTAAIAPVTVGTASVDTFIAWRAGAALLAAVAIQIAVNYANDLFDAERGVDTEERIGPRRATASGLVSPQQMRAAMWSALVVAAVAGSALALAVGPELWLVGLASFFAMLGYSGGPKPYASLGLGEVFVFIFFGLVATVGSAYVQVERIDEVAVAASIPVGFLAVAILVVNNVRDIATDATAGKRTLAVRMGEVTTKRLYVALLLGTVAAVPVIALTASSPLPLVALLACPLFVIAARSVLRGSGPALLPALGATARAQLVFGGLLALGLGIAR